MTALNIVQVSILARSGDRALRQLSYYINCRQGVSILARSGDRALRNIDLVQLITRWFQSSPGLVTGRYFHPRDPIFYNDQVSILARSGDRALPEAGWHDKSWWESFNPRPVW